MRQRQGRMDRTGQHLVWISIVSGIVMAGLTEDVLLVVRIGTLGMLGGGTGRGRIGMGHIPTVHVSIQRVRDGRVADIEMAAGSVMATGIGTGADLVVQMNRGRGWSRTVAHRHSMGRWQCCQKWTVGTCSEHDQDHM